MSLTQMPTMTTKAQANPRGYGVQPRLSRPARYSSQCAPTSPGVERSRMAANTGIPRYRQGIYAYVPKADIDRLLGPQTDKETKTMEP